MLILNLYVPTGIIVAIVAVFLFSCGFIAGYCFGSLAASDSKKSSSTKSKGKTSNKVSIADE